MPPELKEWKQLLNAEIGNLGNRKDDILNIIQKCEEYDREIRMVSDWLGQNLGFVQGIRQQFTSMYRLRFDEEPRPPARVNNEQMSAIKTEINIEKLDTRDTRKNAIRKIALEITNPGEEISDQVIYDELKKQNMEIVAGNPNAVISTVMDGYIEEFDRVLDKKGVHKRKTN